MSDSPDPIVDWHDRLNDSLAAESAGWLDARQRARGLVFGDRPLCTVLRPRFLSGEDWRYYSAAATDLIEALRVAGDAAAADPAFRAQFRLTDWEETLFITAPRLHTPIPLGRVDAFVDPDTGRPMVTEFNGETPAGAAYQDVLAELFLTMPAMRGFARDWIVRPIPARHHLFNTLLETWHRFRGVRTLPVIAIVDWDDVPTQAEFGLCRDYFVSSGCQCVITTPEALSYRDGVLRDDAGTAIDLVYKRVLLHELVAASGLEHPLIRATLDGAVCLVNPPACKPLHKKASLAVLSDERNAAVFGDALSESIGYLVPWTRVVEERHTEFDGTTIDLVPWISGHRNELVLKPNDEYGGAGIVLGREVDSATWDLAVARALAEPYVVQRRIALPSEPFAAISDGSLVFDQRIVDTAPFCWHGAWADGMLCRISTSTLVNVTAGGGSTVPTFVVQSR
ncbi:MAG: hypothetical protein ACREL5_13470 [Gemmatimonadales bacterium]